MSYVKLEKNMNKSTENVESEFWKGKYESLMRDHQALIQALEVLEETHGFTVEDLEKKQEEMAELVNKIGAMQKIQEKLEKDIDELMSSSSLEESETENLNVKKTNNNIGSDQDVIVLSDDDDKGNKKESSEYYFIL